MLPLTKRAGLGQGKWINIESIQFLLVIAWNVNTHALIDDEGSNPLAFLQGFLWMAYWKNGSNDIDDNWGLEIWTFHKNKVRGGRTCF